MYAFHLFTYLRLDFQGIFLLFYPVTEKSPNEFKIRVHLNVFSFLLMPCSFCYFMSWDFFNILCHDTFPDNNFSSSAIDFCWWPWPLVNMELMSAFTFIHTSAVSTFFAISLKLICLLHIFLMYLGKNLISASCRVYVHFPYLTYLSFPHFKFYLYFYLYHIISDVYCLLILDCIMQVWFHPDWDPVSSPTNSVKWDAERLNILYRNIYAQTLVVKAQKLLTFFKLISNFSFFYFIFFFQVQMLT